MDRDRPNGGWRSPGTTYRDEGIAPAAPESGAESEADMMSVIGHGILVTGNIEAEVDLQIEGRVQGDVRCATLILGEKGSVVGKVFAQRVRVSGAVEGGIVTTDLAIEASARVDGDVTYSRIRIANGGILSGKLTHAPLDDERPDYANVTSLDKANNKRPKDLTKD